MPQGCGRNGEQVETGLTSSSGAVTSHVITDQSRFSLKGGFNYFHEFWKGVRLPDEPPQTLALEALESGIVTEAAGEDDRNRRIYATKMLQSFLPTHYRHCEIKKNKGNLFVHLLEKFDRAKHWAESSRNVG